MKSRTCAPWRSILKLLDFGSDSFDWVAEAGLFVKLLDRVAIADFDNLLDAVPVEDAELTDRRRQYGLSTRSLMREFIGHHKL